MFLGYSLMWKQVNIINDRKFIEEYLRLQVKVSLPKYLRLLAFANSSSSRFYMPTMSTISLTSTRLYGLRIAFFNCVFSSNFDL
jgi:hypothetical protein